MTVGERIKQRRRELGLNADELGARIGKDRSTIYRYEKGDIESVPFDILKLIASTLDISPQELLGWETPAPDTGAAKDSIELISECTKATIQLVKKCPMEKQNRLYKMVELFLEDDE